MYKEAKRVIAFKEFKDKELAEKYGLRFRIVKTIDDVIDVSIYESEKIFCGEDAIDEIMQELIYETLEPFKHLLSINDVIMKKVFAKVGLEKTFQDWYKGRVTEMLKDYTFPELIKNVDEEGLGTIFIDSFLDDDSLQLKIKLCEIYRG